MATIATIQSTDVISSSRTDLNTNFSNLNNDKIETSYLDTDTALTANSDSKIATQKAVKTYVDSGGNPNASLTTKGISEEATAAEIDAGTQTGLTGAELFINPKYLNDCKNVPTVVPGTSGNVMVSNGTDWVSQVLSVPVPQQTILLKEFSSSYPAYGSIRHRMTSDSTGSVFYATYQDSNSSTLYIFRMTKDVNGILTITHETSLTIGSGNYGDPVIIGNYLYISTLIGGVASLRRYSNTDLSGVTSMTFSGTSTNGICFTDGTDIYINYNPTSFYRYTISGTTVTNVGSVSFTSLPSSSGAIFSDGVNVWNTNTSSGAITLKKYLISGGSSTASSTFNYYSNTYNPYTFFNETNGGMVKLNNGTLGLCTIYGDTNASTFNRYVIQIKIQPIVAI